ncbi:MAG: hypothetical protein R3321_10700 [Nitrososphaeraceae archaeon]|nr:hypothetical protein [Nitrososphaeraceae archaeon]
MKIAIVEKIRNDKLALLIDRDYEIFKKRLPNLAVEYFRGNKELLLNNRNFIERKFGTDKEKEMAEIIKKAVEYALMIYEREIKEETITLHN